jgi:hypothetical protein
VSGDAYPRVVATPGATLTEVAAASTMPLVLPAPDADPGLVQPNGPHVVVIAHPELGFELPPGLFTLIEASAGVVHTVRSSPHIDYLDGGAAGDLAATLDEGLRARGWARVEPDHDGPLEPVIEDGRGVAATLVGGGWTAEIHLRLVHEAGSASARYLELEADGWLVTLIVSAAGR